MRSAPKTAAYGLFSALLLALTVTGEPTAAINPENRANSLAHEITPPTLTLSDRISTTGFYGVSWELSTASLPEGATLLRFEVQEREEHAGEVAWAPLYSGPDEATTLTGIPDGVYAYRVRAVLLSEGTPDTAFTAWSTPESLEVRHHSLTKALGFLAVGANVFLGTLTLIVVGHRRQGR